ncbi:Odorant-binding protein 21 [Halyomorpha halys]|nr:Odorant-binding protein 21 [Halyomorpha halys]
MRYLVLCVLLSYGVSTIDIPYFYFILYFKFMILIALIDHSSNHSPVILFLHLSFVPNPSPP